MWCYEPATVVISSLLIAGIFFALGAYLWPIIRGR